MSTIKLTVNDISILNQPMTKDEAIKCVSQNMIDANLVKSDYTQAMFDREAQISTFLGNGIAIPHGTTDKRDSVLETGLKILFSQQGINWDEDNNVAYVVIGIAARSDEHLGVLRQLTRAVIAEDTVERILAVKSPEDLLAILEGE